MASLVLAMALVGCGSTPVVADASRDARIRALSPDVTEVRVEDGLLMIRLTGGWSDFAARRFACESVKPIVGDQEFAIYDDSGAVLATGRSHADPIC